MRQIEDSWQVNVRNPQNEFETLKNIHERSVLTAEDKIELNGYRNNLVRDLINKKCSSVCLNSKDTNFKNCFDNCETKLQNADQIFAYAKNEYSDFKKNQSFV